VKPTIAILTTLAVFGIGGPALAKQRSSEDAQFRRWLTGYLLHMPYNEDDPDLQNLVYGYALVDLNGDGRNEAVVWARDANLCGTSGCGLEVFEHGKSGWRFLIDVATTRPPIKILPTRTHGWRDLSSWQYGGGVDHPYEAWWHFNGRHDYDSSKTKWKVPKRIHGRIIIKDASIPLFPSKCHKVEEGPSVFGPMPVKSTKAGSC
jgi:hypothetical protein